MTHVECVPGSLRFRLWGLYLRQWFRNQAVQTVGYKLRIGSVGWISKARPECTFTCICWTGRQVLYWLHIGLKCDLTGSLTMCAYEHTTHVCLWVASWHLQWQVGKCTDKNKIIRKHNNTTIRKIMTKHNPNQQFNAPYHKTTQKRYRPINCKLSLIKKKELYVNK